jgi:cardiolipin synthase
MLKKIPNILTIGRIILVPFFVLAFYLPGFYGDLTAFALFVIASFTDFLDGMLARMLGEESKLGELLDPIADKIIVATALILLVMDGTIKNYELKTFLQMISISLLLTGETGNKILNFQDYNAQTIGIILLWLSAFLTIFTGYEYLRKGIDHAMSEDSKN